MPRFLVLLFPSALMIVTSVHAADWPHADVDKALAIVADSQNRGLAECVRDAGTEIKREAEQTDINKDGINELVIRSFPAALGNGVTSCFGQVGVNIDLLIADGKGGWVGNLGFDAHGLSYHPRRAGGWPDIELTGPGFCFPIWRYHEGRYGPWQVCDGQILIFADVAPWIKGQDGIVPRDAGEDFGPVEQPDVAGHDFKPPEFDHNGSVVAVDHRRGVIYYVKPKKSIAATVKPGTVLFEGEPWDQYDTRLGIRGTAYVFRKGCEPVSYQVSGGFLGGWQHVVLKGAAPVRKKGSCDVEGHSVDSSNAKLEFLSLYD
jgi:hypothetical protein